MDLLAAHQGYVKDYLVHPRGAYWFTENVWMDKA
jgi:hypothetical protein